MSDAAAPASWAAILSRAHLTVLERGWLSSNGALFDAPGAPTVLVDTGYATHAEQTVALVRRRLGARALDRIVNTHLHSDHCGGNAALQAAWPCATDVPAGEAAAVDAWDEAALTYRYTGQECPRFARTGAIAAGDRVVLGGRTWHAIASPGHDPRSFVLHDPELELLLSADALWERGFGIVFPAIDDPHGEDGFAAVRTTLATLRRLDVRFVIPGHGAPFTDVSAALDRAEALVEALEADPERHARHAAKVLLKFHLMAVRAEPLEAFAAWVASTPALHALRTRYAPGTALGPWLDGLVRDLERSRAVHRDGDRILDR